jgi:outer membrane lipoprotein-sorting protein
MMAAMQSLTARRLRWAVPFAAGAAVAAAAILPGVAAGSDHPNLPGRSAQQLLTDLLEVRAPALSGTVVESAHLGLPELPTAGGGGSADLSWPNLVAGSHTLRIWVDGPEKQRVALVGELAESDVVHNGTSVWLYSSHANQATRITVPADAGKSAEDQVTRQLPTPAEAAAQAIAAITPTTKVSVDDTARVAGRPVYQLVLQPKDSRSLIGRVTIAVDSETSVPLRVQVYARGASSPAFETGYTDVTFAKPPASVFRFIPPTGAKVTTATAGQVISGERSAGGDGAISIRKPGTAAPTQTPSVRTSPGGPGSPRIGEGWTTVVVTDASTSSFADGSSSMSTLMDAFTPVKGGRLLATALVSVLITDDGKMYVGAVTPAALQQVAKTGKPL